MQKQKQKLDYKLEYIINDRDYKYKYTYYTSIFIRIIGIEYSYSIKAKEFRIIEFFDKFQIILDSNLRLLELTTKLRKRVGQLIRSYATSIGVLLSARNLIGTKRNDPNNSSRFIPTREAKEDNTTQLVQYNSDRQISIQQQLNGRITILEGRRYCQYTIEYIYSRYIYLKNKIAYDSYYKYKVPYRCYKNQYSTTTLRLTIVVLVPIRGRGRGFTLRAIATVVAVALLLVPIRGQG